MSIDVQSTMWRNRKVKPFALALLLSMVTLCIINILDIGLFGNHILGDVVGVIAGGTAVLFIAAWTFKNQSLLEMGLLFASGVWMTRAAFDIFLNGFSEFGIYMSLCWVIGAAGSFLIERKDGRSRS